MASEDLETLARILDSSAAAYYAGSDPESALAYHSAKSALLAAVSRLPGRRWWRRDTCYEWTEAGLLVWSEPGSGYVPHRRSHPLRGVRLHSGPGIVPRVGEPLHPVRQSRRVSA